MVQFSGMGLGFPLKHQMKVKLRAMTAGELESSEARFGVYSRISTEQQVLSALHRTHGPVTNEQEKLCVYYAALSPSLQGL